MSFFIMLLYFSHVETYETFNVISWITAIDQQIHYLRLSKYLIFLQLTIARDVRIRFKDDVLRKRFEIYIY